MVFSLLMVMLVLLIFKWKKVLTVIITVEMGSLLILSSFYMMMGTAVIPLVFLLVFIVGEALVLLSAFYLVLQSVGQGSGSLVMS